MEGRRVAQRIGQPRGAAGPGTVRLNIPLSEERRRVQYTIRRGESEAFGNTILDPPTRGATIVQHKVQQVCASSNSQA